MLFSSEFLTGVCVSGEFSIGNGFSARSDQPWCFAVRSNHVLKFSGEVSTSVAILVEFSIDVGIFLGNFSLFVWFRVHIIFHVLLIICLSVCLFQAVPA